MFGSFKYDCFYDEDTCILEWWNRGIVLMERLVVEKKNRFCMWKQWKKIVRTSMVFVMFIFIL